MDREVGRVSVANVWVADGIATVAVAEDVDIATADQFRATVAAALAAYPRVVVDLTAARYFDSSGLRVLFEFADRLCEVVVPRAGLLPRVLALVALDQVLLIRQV